MSKRLVAFFSASGVTADLAKTLAWAANADLYEIRPEVPYTDADLDWRDDEARSAIEMHDMSFRPAIADRTANIADYSVIFIGFPIWWYVAPTIINTFLESYDFSGKVIVPFATSGGSGMGETTAMLMPSVSDEAVWKEGRVFGGRVSKEALAEWLEALGLDMTQ